MVTDFLHQHIIREVSKQIRHTCCKVLINAESYMKTYSNMTYLCDVQINMYCMNYDATHSTEQMWTSER